MEFGKRAAACAGRLFDRADLGAGELGVDEELERVGLLVLLHEAVQGGAAQPGQGDAGGVAQQAWLDDLQREGVIALADEGGSGAANCSGGAPHPRDVPLCRRRVTMRAVRPQRFRAVITASPRGRAVIAVPFSPDDTWGAKAEHPVGGTINGGRVRGTLSPDTTGWALTVSPMWLRDTGAAIGDDVTVELAPEGPQRGDLADDIAAASGSAGTAQGHRQPHPVSATE